VRDFRGPLAIIVGRCRRHPHGGFPTQHAPIPDPTLFGRRHAPLPDSHVPSQAFARIRLDGGARLRPGRLCVLGRQPRQRLRDAQPARQRHPLRAAGTVGQQAAPAGMGLPAPDERRCLTGGARPPAGQHAGQRRHAALPGPARHRPVGRDLRARRRADPGGSAPARRHDRPPRRQHRRGAGAAGGAGAAAARCRLRRCLA